MNRDCPICLNVLQSKQQADSYLQEQMIRRQQHNNIHQPLYHRKAYGNFDLIERLNYKGTKYHIVLPIAHASSVVECYNNFLRHPGASRLTKTIQANFIYPQLEQHVKNFTASCHIFQRIKDSNPREGQLQSSIHGKKLLLTVLVLGSLRLASIPLSLMH